MKFNKESVILAVIGITVGLFIPHKNIELFIIVVAIFSLLGVLDW